MQEINVLLKIEELARKLRQEKESEARDILAKKATQDLYKDRE